jgi:hypothetical protein
VSSIPESRDIRGTNGNFTLVGDWLAKGGVGAIYRTTDPRWVYKEYSSPGKAPPAAYLQRLVNVGRDVLLEQGLQIASQPESSVNWPVDIIRNSGQGITGCILPAIPQRYFRADVGGINTLDFLVMRRARPPAAKARVIVLLRLAEILAYINEKKLVHGDINAKNVAWTLTPQPSAYLIDCDGIVPQYPPPTAGVQAVHWTDPRVIDNVVPAHDHYSDWYCLALAFYRGLLLPQGGSLAKRDGLWAVPSQIPDDLDPRIANLLRRALADALDAKGRPEPAEWVRAILDVYVPGGRYDDEALSVLDRAIAMSKAKTSGPEFVRVPPLSRPAPPKPRTPPTAQPTSARPPPQRQPPAQPSPTAQRVPQPYGPQMAVPPGAPLSLSKPYRGQQHYRRPHTFARGATNGGKEWSTPLLLVLILGPIGVFFLILVSALASSGR